MPLAGVSSASVEALLAAIEAVEMIIESWNAADHLDKRSSHQQEDSAQDRGKAAHKIAVKHGVSADEVRDALICTPGLSYVWDDSPTRGRRAIVRTRIRGLAYLAVLYPDVRDSSCWDLGSVYLA
jgi:hypothetical protein